MQAFHFKLDHPISRYKKARPANAERALLCLTSGRNYEA